MTIFLVCLAVLIGLSLFGIGYCNGRTDGWSEGFQDGFRCPRTNGRQ